MAAPFRATDLSPRRLTIGYKRNIEEIRRAKIAEGDMA